MTEHQEDNNTEHIFPSTYFDEQVNTTPAPASSSYGIPLPPDDGIEQKKINKTWVLPSESDFYIRKLENRLQNLHRPKSKKRTLQIPSELIRANSNNQADDSANIFDEGSIDEWSLNEYEIGRPLTQDYNHNNEHNDNDTGDEESQINHLLPKRGISQRKYYITEYQKAFKQQEQQPYMRKIDNSRESNESLDDNFADFSHMEHEQENYHYLDSNLNITRAKNMIPTSSNDSNIDNDTNEYHDNFEHGNDLHSEEDDEHRNGEGCCSSLLCCWRFMFGRYHSF
eukprot:gb/GECH01010367.1/.p1 GENE.gb/GECH01010367.1/~~gb/GECH01010367.1/.p1  ORF type:complete len:283 (+),score=71.68 gb/GECH01010367.1/:1-849(+)